MTEAAADIVPENEVRGGGRAVRAAYFAFVLWIPIETVFYFKKEGAPPDAGGITVSSLLGLLLFGLALLDIRRCFRRFPAAFWMITWYLATYAASQLWIPRELDAMFRARQLTLIQMAGLFLMSANLFEETRFREAVLRFYGWWVGAVAAAMLLGAFEVNQGRSSISSQNPNVVAAFFALAALCLVGDPRLFDRKRSPALLLASLLPVAVIIFAILRTGSRGGLIGFAAGILALGACAGQATRSRRLFLVAAVVGALILLIAREFALGTATATRLDAAWSTGDTTGRDVIWKTAWDMFLHRPFFGYGGANNIFTLGVHMNYPDRDTHNQLLAVLTEVGLVGSLPFIAAIIDALRWAWRHGGRTGDVLPFALMAALVTMSFDQTISHQKIFWICLAAAVACGFGLDPGAKPADAP